MASSCARGVQSHRKGCKALEHTAREVVKSLSLEIFNKTCRFSTLRTWFSSKHGGGDRLMVGHDDPNYLFQP